MIQEFDVEITFSLSRIKLHWPEYGEAGANGEDRGFGGNRNYCDLRSMSWSEARRVYDYERELVDRIEQADDPDEEYVRIEDELYDDPCGLYGLDLGTASSVIALSAARCVPFTSCNAGTFGGKHHEQYPLVAFFARPSHVALLLECSRVADCGLEHGSNGSVVLFARSIQDLRNFAGNAISRSSDFGKLRFEQDKNCNKDPDMQLKLF